MGDETTASIEAAAQAFAEAVDTWREQAVGAPDLFLEATMRLQESIDVPLAGHGNGIKPGRVERRITLWPRLRGTPTVVMCAGCRAFGARATEEDVPEGWSRAADDPDELWCGACTNQAGP
jgi:hypothetical protein